MVTNPARVFRIVQIARSGSSFTLNYPTVADRKYVTEFTTDFLTWQDLTGDGTITSLTFNFPGFPKAFLRVRVGS